MSFDRFQQRITSPEELQDLLGTPSELVIRKQLSSLDSHMQAFLGEAPFAILGTVDHQGRCDVSPRGDSPAVARVLDADTILMAERPGNRRADSLRNILETGQVATLFFIPGLGETLRINGRACLIRDDEVLAPFAEKRKLPQLGIAISVEECYLQCAKALIRSRLWDAPAPLKTPELACYAKILIDQTKVEETVESLDKQIQESYTQRLY